MTALSQEMQITKLTAASQILNHRPSQSTDLIITTYKLKDNQSNPNLQN